ncbi:MAG: hypothetical protein LBV69_11165, partial [Bacteroidales bacterium]|nr:hypothetical protein [Bacteroidales bacterium]
TVTVTGSNGCTASQSVEITGSTTAPTAGITNNTGTTVLSSTIISISLIATGGGTYNWSHSLGTDANVSVTTPGTYIVTVTNSVNGCSDTESITINSSLATPMMLIHNNTGTTLLTCTTLSISLTTIGGISYVWSDGLGTSENVDIDSPGTYYVTVTTEDATILYDSIVITQNIIVPHVEIHNSIVTLNCETTASMNLTATGGGIYSWSDGLGSNASIIIPLSGGTYTVTVTNPLNGCSTNKSITITP